MLFKSRWTPSSTTAKWCLPSGTVTTAAGTGPAQTCDEQPLGDPSHSSQLWVAGLLGLVHKDIVRWAIGPTFSYDFEAKSSAFYQIGLQAPIYLAPEKWLQSYSGDYKGIVRVVPTAAFNHTSNGVDVVGSVSIELRAQRDMFGSSLYWP